MRFHSSITAEASSIAAAEQLIAQARAATQGRIDVVFFFFTAHHVEEAAELAERLWLELDPECILGCSAEGVMGAAQALEDRPGMAMLVGSLPGVRLHPFRIGRGDWSSLLGEPELLAERIGYSSSARVIIGFGDPFTPPAGDVLSQLNIACPGLPLVGGMASGEGSAGWNVLVRNDQVFDEGFVGVTLSGPVAVESIISQGARPIGRPAVITRSHDNVIEQLGGRPAPGVLQEMIEQLDEAGKKMAGEGLLIGRAVSEYRESFGPGDFLVRNVLGLDEKAGALLVADHVQTGQTVQFHTRDAGSAEEELARMLEKHGGQFPGGLLFSSSHRSAQLFDSPGHDVAAVRRLMPETAVAGFLSAGEFGPVGGRNFIHGQTSSLTLFRSPSA